MEAAPALQGLTLLLVDDDEVDRMSLRRALRSAGVNAEILEASNATHGIEVLRSRRVDCAFLDFNMPARDGLWLVREARSQSIRAPLIVLTGQGDEHTAVELMKAGASDYFSKANATPERVAAALRQALRVYEAEDAYRQSEQRLRLAVEATQLGTWDFHPETGRLDWSERCRELMGLAPTASVNYDVFLSALHADDRERTDLAVKQALDPGNGGVFDVEYRSVGVQGGAERWVRMTGRAFFDDAGKATRFIGTTQDITDRKQLDAQKARLLEAERFAREGAEAASRLREDLVAIVSHDLRNPLSAITTSVSLLRSAAGLDETGRARKYVETIGRSAERMKRLISDLLDMASIDAGHMAIEPTPQSATALLQEAVEMLQPVASDKSLRLEAEDVEPQLAAQADKERVLQVLSNLVGNAIKFTQEGGSVHVRAESADDMVRFSVIDTGQGVPEEQLPHLFDRYWQAKKSGRMGIGLGLSIAKGIVDAHGGQIWAESSPGKGTAFHFTLPTAATEI
jgi:PAS domain S-box-containing protein